MNNHVSRELHSDEIILIIGNSSSNFSGITSAMLQVMSYQKELIKLELSVLTNSKNVKRTLKNSK
jgi:mannosyltransferase